MTVMDLDALELRDARLEEYRAVALYARAYKAAVEAQDVTWEMGMGRELDAALARVRRIEARIQMEAAA